MEIKCSVHCEELVKLILYAVLFIQDWQYTWYHDVVWCCCDSANIAPWLQTAFHFIRSNEQYKCWFISTIFCPFVCLVFVVVHSACCLQCIPFQELLAQAFRRIFCSFQVQGSVTCPGKKVLHRRPSEIMTAWTAARYMSDLWDVISFHLSPPSTSTQWIQVFSL